MKFRLGAIATLLILGVHCFSTPPDKVAPGEERNTVKALFDGLPADLRAKVRDNPVRCDRVNDWLKDQVNGKGKTVEIRLFVKDVLPYRSEDGTYRVHIKLVAANMQLLGDGWQVALGDYNSRRITSGPAEYLPPGGNFSFSGVSSADAEKLADSKEVVIQGKVQEVLLPRFQRNSPDGAAMSVILEEVQVNGKKWTPYKAPDVPFVGGKKAGGKGKKNPQQ
jgi:hypothetical protein